MKKFLGLILVLFICLFSVNAFAAGSIVEQSRSWWNSDKGLMIKIELLCTGDASAGTVPTTAITNLDPNHPTPGSLAKLLGLNGGYLYEVKTAPGTAGATPTAYTVKLYDMDDFLLLDLAARSTTAKEIAKGFETLGQFPAIDNGLKLAIGDPGASDTATVYITVVK